MRKQIEDKYGTKLDAEPLMDGTGPMVDLNVEPPPGSAKASTVTGRISDAGEDFHRLTPDQAIELADQLRAAAEEWR